MSASVVINDANGDEVPLDESNPVEFGTVGSGATSDTIELEVENDGDEDVFFVTVEGVRHPDDQVGSSETTVDAVEVAKTEDGDFGEQVTWDELEEGDAETFFARWGVPSDAKGGPRVWALEAAASTS